MNSAPNHEIVIIRRGGHAHEEGHHGGVWKIAFADFMTAMMAFFLVLWIVNSSSKETRASIARYFNPVKLSDTTPARKGLQTAKELDFDASGGEVHKADGIDDCGEASAPAADASAGHGTAAAASDTPKADDAPKAHEPPKGHDAPKGKTKPGCNAVPSRAATGPFTEETLLQSPQAVLTSIVAAASLDETARADSDAERSGAESEAIETSQAVQGLAPEQVFVDPFEPVSPVLAARPAGEGTPALKASSPKPSKSPIVQSTTLSPHAEEASPEAVSKHEGASSNRGIILRDAVSAEMALDEGKGHVQTVDKPTSPAAAPARSPAPGLAQGPKPPSRETNADPARLEAAVRARLADDLGEALKDELAKRSGPIVEIKAVPEGTLISLTDGLDFGMFAVGSAEPQPRAIAVMARIAGVLKRYPGALVIRGHTDGRQYPSARYDNWHLSADRAQMSYQMLLRGGLEARRLDRIEGHADRSLKNSADVGAAENRRIEILLKADRP